MSMAIARAKYTGDPGFFDFIKKAVGVGTSFIPFVGPTISQAILQSGAGPGSVPTNGARFMGPTQGNIIKRPADSSCPTGYTGYGKNQCIAAVPAPGIAAAGQRFFQGGASGMMAAPLNGMAMGPGYHLNKSSYFLLSGEYVPAGTRWVKNRKRNPANARATSRAISRISGAKTYAKALGRISIRKKC